jgi:hypothetical protein
MKKLIDGLLYDTESAEEIASWSNGLSYSDFNHMDETLYRTESGRWFIHGGGGPKTKYRKPAAGGGVTGSEDIRALTDAEAFEWLQAKNNVSAAQEYFADRIEAA